MIKPLKSQIGIFVVIAVIIVLIGVLFFSLNSDSLNFFRDQDGTYQVKEFVETCLNIELKEAQRQIGLHGGWLYLPENKQILYIDRNTNSELVKFGSGFDFFRVEIPYWYHYSDSLNSFDSSGFPSYDDDLPSSIKSQLKRYVDSNLDESCLKGFSNFEGLYDISYDPDEIDTIVEFEDDEILIELEFSVLVKDINKNESDFFDFFKDEQYNKVQVPYFIARDIVEAERESSFIEKRMMQFLNHRMDHRTRDSIPPTYEYSIDSSPDFRPWIVKDVERKVKEILSSNIDLIEFYNTDVSKSYSIPEGLENNDFANSFYSIYEKDYLSEYSISKDSNSKVFRRYEDYSVELNYESFYPIDFKLSPSLGNIILMPSPEFYLGGLIPFITNEYKATYEFTTPVLIEIKDSKNLNDNFVFNLAIEANIAHNTPLKENLDISELNFDLEDFSTSSLVCNPSQFQSKHVVLNISDRINYGQSTGARGEPRIGVDDAFVTFNCKGFSTCYLGQTKINGANFFNNITQLRFRLPIDCNPGTLEISKFGHKTLKFENLNPNFNEEINLGSVFMDSQKEFDLTLDVVSLGSSFSRPRGIDEEESGFLIVTNLEDENIVQVIEFNHLNQNDLKIKLLPGNYNFKGFLFYNDKILIPGKTITYDDSPLNPFDDDKKVTIPEIELDTWISGGIELESFEIRYSSIITKKKLTVKLIDFGIPENFEDFTKISELMGDLVDLSNGRKPKFS